MSFASKIQDGCAHIPSVSVWKVVSFNRLSVQCVAFNVIVIICLGPANG